MRPMIGGKKITGIIFVLFLNDLKKCFTIDFYIYLNIGNFISNQVSHDKFGLCYEGENII
jgi:hypothetical protein